MMDQIKYETGVVWHECTLLHVGPSDIVEVPERITSIVQELEAQNLMDHCIRIDARSATPEELLKTHDKKYVRELFDLHERDWEDGEFITPNSDDDMFASRGTVEAALTSAGGIIECISKVMEEEVD